MGRQKKTSSSEKDIKMQNAIASNVFELVSLFIRVVSTVMFSMITLDNKPKES